jgi:uncharacterized protein HemY
MGNDREAQFKQLVADFPQSPMGHFSLGKLYLEQKRWDEAAASLERATQLDPSYAAAMVSLGDAHAAAGRAERAREVFERAKELALAQKHSGLADEIDDRIADL